MRGAPGRVLLVLLGLATPLGAAGPAHVARADRSLWPHLLDSPAAFDRASRAEILCFTQALARSETQDEAALVARVGRKSVSLPSIVAWRQETFERLFRQFVAASEGCSAEEWLCHRPVSQARFVELARGFSASVPERYASWHAAAAQFHETYLTELLRLAALFPRTSSEVGTFSSRERNGFELGDRHFLLTFDDGPDVPGADGDELMRALRREKVNGSFFLLGERLARQRQSESAEHLRARYAGMCVASHGQAHRSHQTWPEWQGSVAESRELIAQTFGELYRPLFRPPYGQRTSDSDAYFAKQGLTVLLWNIDSQDWYGALSPPQARDRVVTLMLLWRRGVVLFHDVIPKAAQVVPSLLADLRAAGVVWDDCRTTP